MSVQGFSELTTPTPTSMGRRPRVLDVVRHRVSVEQGSLRGLGTLHRVAVVAHWSDSPLLSRSFVTLVAELASADYRVVVSSCCESSAPLEWGGRRPPGTIVLRRPNVGYDFGSWATALSLVPGIAEAETVVLTNDSLVGPFAPMADILRRVDENRADVVGMTDVRQFFRHLQSYFLRFSGGILSDEPLRRFYADVRGERTKWDIIRRYELGLTRLLQTESYGFSPVFRADRFVSGGENPVIASWWRLLSAGFPFVKREILRRPDIAPRSEWVDREVYDVYRQRIEEWI